MTYKRLPPEYGKEAADCQWEEMENPFVEFVTRFRQAGGKFIPCVVQNMVEYLIKIIQGQKYGLVLNTNPNLAPYLKKHNVCYANAINANEPADAAIIFSDMLVARTGAIGFTQSIAQYASVKNLAKDIIVISRSRSIFVEMEDALAYLQQQSGNQTPPIVEFIIPTNPEEINGKPQYSLQQPRIVLVLVEETIPQTTTTPTTTTNTPSENESTTTPTSSGDESQN